MFQDQSVCVVVPAHNEERLITQVLETMPDYVDHIVVVDDCSPDNTAQKVTEHSAKDPRVHLVRHTSNQGVGGAIASGYQWAIDNKCDLTVVMAGDGQMEPDDLPQLLKPVADGLADASKGNRLFTGEAYRKIPKIRFFGNAVLSMLTKIASGYWHIADSQSGYVVVNNNVLNTIDWSKMYRRYGQPNDLLVRLNVHDFVVVDVPTEPIYNIGEVSGIRIRKVIFSISWLLLKLFAWRMKEKYIIRNFHPLVFFYGLGILFTGLTGLLSIRLFILWFMNGFIPPINALAAMFSFMSGSMFILFAMWFDMEENRELRLHTIRERP